MSAEALNPRMASEKLPWDPIILVSVIVLTVLGVVMVYSSSAMFAGSRLGDSAYFLKRQATFALIGVLAMATIMKVGYRTLERFAYPILVLSIIGIALTYLPGLGLKAGGAQRWIRAFGVQLQPSEFAKIGLCIYLAKSISDKGDAIKSFKFGFLPHMLVVGLLGAMVLLQPDFGTLVVMATVTIAVLFAAGAPVTYIFVSVGLAVPIAALLVFTSPYRRARIEAFLDPFEDRWGSGYQVAEALMSLGSGGIFGRGLGEGRQKLGFLPAGHTDYILASIGEELGLIGIAVVLGLFTLLVVRGYRAMRESTDSFGAWLAFGLTTLVAVETLVNAGMCLALLPPKGIALPFVSYGGTSVVKGLIIGGVLLSISNGGGGYLLPSFGASRCR